jgi:hypothetical protein
MFSKLVYEGMGQIVIPTTATYATRRWRPSAAFDIDPLIGSDAIPGFAELAALYGNYRVTVSRAHMMITNPSTSLGVQLIVVPLSEDPGASPDGNTLNSWPDNPFAKSKLCGLLGSPPCSITCEMTTEKLFGTNEVYTDDVYAASVATVPSRNWYWAVGVATGTAPTANISCTLVYKFDIGIKFYKRKFVDH